MKNIKADQGVDGFCVRISELSKEEPLPRFKDWDPLYVLVVLGGHDLTTDEPNSVVLNSTEYIYHKDWDEATFQNDIGLIKLPRTVTLNNIIKTVTWARGSESYAHNVSTAIGWGETDIGRPLILREVTTTILTNEACAAADPVLADLIVPSHLCISGVGTVGTCRGDSGGPLLVDGVQVGITSFGFINCTAAMPSMFTRITEFNDWILEHAIDGSSSHQQLFYSLLLSGVISLVHFLYCI
ncbi:hypothetical protein NQ314_000047 [Rhamnusium bicolor]|uniref:Peptidase S1 domain-containing protein n=1 Tax=Rhamnusium bicolor TaxID=1586634 RepID=A0AAV8ZWG5_9CUCU|nr:hypothetical protein NQ314_000047 [Rhamnusium bicolor]